MQAIIRVENISWQRQGRKILEDVTWEVKPGEQWAILGLNGSGKTSLLNIVTGFQFPSSGYTEVLGTVFGKGGNIPNLRQEIGFVSSALKRFEKPFNSQTAKAIVLTGKYQSAQIFSFHEITAEDEARAEAILERLGIGYLTKQYYRTCSQGEQRRILIARALMNRPRLLILDEPCAGLDVKAREEVLAMIDRLAASETQVLYVTHYIEEITPAITHLLLLKDGSVVAQGPKAEVLTDENLTQTYKLPVSIREHQGRAYLQIEQA
ncbi:molybdenum ABC transporter ATP-binding protein [Suicoccus acidiformans]|uniref:Molybdenum ABC transporter ATP-binding protein n=1 Tax=Suicoccus acidiformans TaxID=2036206 RepID=A0A347WLV2_9LACT|nr:ABC transporter ATP-binding protein [Suicoccus acidiformans]AXY26059.1 molybdenum ABC transporter ATP-binding protein [Suicoccus acidiformans]